MWSVNDTEDLFQLYYLFPKLTPLDLNGLNAPANFMRKISVTRMREQNFIHILKTPPLPTVLSILELFIISLPLLVAFLWILQSPFLVVFIPHDISPSKDDSSEASIQP